MPQTPRSDRATTRKPETAPPRIATWTASTRLRRAAAAVRTFDRTLIVIPMMPDSIEQPAPTRNATAVMIPIGRPASSGTSATSFVSTKVMTAPMMSAPMIASPAIVEYWRRTNASAPSRIMSATSCIACGPLSRDSTSRARYRAKSTAATPAIGMINWSVVALIRVWGSSTVTGSRAADRAAEPAHVSGIRARGTHPGSAGGPPGV